MSLNDRQLRFAIEYVACGVATTAALNAGYSDKTAYAQGSALLKHPEVMAEIERRKTNIEKRVLGRYEVTREKIVRELATLGFSNMSDYTAIDGNDIVLDMSTVDRDQLGAVKEITSEVYTEGRGDEARAVKRTKFSLYDKRAALMDLAKLEGHVVDRQQLTGANGGPIQTMNAHVVAAAELNPETRAKLREALEAMDDDDAS